MPTNLRPPFRPGFTSSRCLTTAPQKHPWFNSLVKFGVAFPVTYHLLGGLRHLVSIPYTVLAAFIDRYQSPASTGIELRPWSRGTNRSCH